MDISKMPRTVNVDALRRAVLLEGEIARQRAAVIAESEADMLVGQEPDVDDESAWNAWSDRLDESYDRHGLASVRDRLEVAQLDIVRAFADVIATFAKAGHAESQQLAATVKLILRGDSLPGEKRAMIAGAKRLVAKSRARA